MNNGDINYDQFCAECHVHELERSPYDKNSESYKVKDRWPYSDICGIIDHKFWLAKEEHGDNCTYRVVIPENLEELDL